MTATQRTRVRTVRADSRLPQILDVAAEQFAAQGYQATSVRDIVGRVGMLPGSLYCHFANKEELLAAVYAEGVRRIAQAVDDAVAGRRGPWQRLEAACAAHLAALLDDSAYAKVVVNVHPRDVPPMAQQLTTLRQGYEQRFVDLFDDLPGLGKAQRRHARLMLLGALNWTPVWFRADRCTPAQVAKDHVRVLRQGLQRSPLTPDGGPS